jgi:hypothetical protein
MTREGLRNRRLPEVLEFQAMGMRLTGSVSRYPDGRPGEIFIDNHKAGSGVATLARHMAIAVSFALQHGADADATGGRCAATATASRSARSACCSTLLRGIRHDRRAGDAQLRALLLERYSQQYLDDFIRRRTETARQMVQSFVRRAKMTPQEERA